MRRKLRLILAYDGTDFHGWQRQPGVRTVQGEVEACLRGIFGGEAEVIGASRTDAGVHALGQTAHTVAETPIPDANLGEVIDHRLPADIGLVSCDAVTETFDAIRGAREKLYRYRIYNARRRPVCVLAQRYCWHVDVPLDAAAMQAAAAHMSGRRDFGAFASAGSPRESNVRTVSGVSVARDGDEIRVDISGDGFLYNQVRNMVGTLVEVGRGHWRPEHVAQIVASCDRRNAGPTAPPQGLCLQWVRYDT